MSHGVCQGLLGGMSHGVCRELLGRVGGSGTGGVALVGWHWSSGTTRCLVWSLMGCWLHPTHSQQAAHHVVSSFQLCCCTPTADLGWLAPFRIISCCCLLLPAVDQLYATANSIPMPYCCLPSTKPVTPAAFLPLQSSGCMPHANPIAALRLISISCHFSLPLQSSGCMPPPSPLLAALLYCCLPETKPATPAALLLLQSTGCMHRHVLLLPGPRPAAVRALSISCHFSLPLQSSGSMPPPRYRAARAAAAARTACWPA